MELNKVINQLNFTDEQKVLFVQSVLEAGKRQNKSLVEKFLYENVPASINDNVYKELVETISKKAINNDFGLLEESEFKTDIVGKEVSFDNLGNMLKDISLEIEKMSDSEKKVIKNNKELEAKLAKLSKNLGLTLQKEEKENSCPKCGADMISSEGKEKCSECGYIKTQKDVGEAIDKAVINKRDISTSAGGGVTGDGGAEQVKILKGPKKGQHGLVVSDLRIDGKLAVEVQGEIVVLDFGDVEAMGSKYEHKEGDKKKMVREQDYADQVKKLEDAELLKLAKQYDDPAMEFGGNIPIDIVKDEIKKRGLMKEETIKLTKCFAEGYVAGHSDYAKKEVKESFNEKSEDFIKGYNKAIAENKEKELEERKKLEESVTLLDVLEAIKELTNAIKESKQEKVEEKSEEKVVEEKLIDVDSIIEKHHNGEITKEEFVDWFNRVISETEEDNQEKLINYIVEKNNDTDKEDLKINVIEKDEEEKKDEEEEKKDKKDDEEEMDDKEKEKEKKEEVKIDSEKIVNESIADLFETDKERVKELADKLEYRTEEELKEQLSEIIKGLNEQINNNKEPEKKLSSSEQLMEKLGLLR